MNTMFMSDTFGHHEALLLPRGDMIIHAGNITRNGTKAEAKDFLQWFSHINYKYRIFIAGPQDVCFEQEPSGMRDLLPANVIYLEGCGAEIGGFRIWGAPYSTLNHGSAFHAADVEQHWDDIPDDSDIVICRTPAYGVQDETETGEHSGCKALLRRLVRIEPSYFVCGNIHGVRRHDYLYQINFINASLSNHECEVARKPVFFRNP